MFVLTPYQHGRPLPPLPLTTGARLSVGTEGADLALPSDSGLWGRLLELEVEAGGVRVRPLVECVSQVRDEGSTAVLPGAEFHLRPGDGIGLGETVRLVLSVAPGRTPPGRVDPAGLSEDERRDLLLARLCLERGWADLAELNRALEGCDLGQSLVSRGTLGVAQLAEILPLVREQMTRPIEDALDRAPWIDVRREDARLILLDGGAPDHLGPYTILERVAAGGMGTVYRAVHPALERTVALKVIRPASGLDPEEAARFRREAKMAARLEHPGIVRVWDVGRDRGLEYIAMDFVEGGELPRFLADRDLDVPARLRLLARVAAAVGYAHRQGIIHRDLKPGNILVSPEGAPIVSDFGLARPICDDQNLTKSTTILGTPRYMAPEAIRADASVGPPADVYSLGAVLFEVLTGRPMNPSTDMLTAFQWALTSFPGPIVVGGKRADPEIQAIFQRCVEKDPAHRYPDGAALAAELERYLAGEPIETRLPGLGRRFARALPTWLRPAGRSASLAALLCLMPWAVHQIASATGLGDPVVVLQIFCDVVAVVVGALVYVALNQRRTLEEERAPLLRELDVVRRRLAETREREASDRGVLLPEEPRLACGESLVVAVVEPAPAEPAACAALRAIGSGAVAFLLVDRGPASAGLAALGAVRGRFDLLPSGALADPVEALVRLGRPAGSTVGVGFLCGERLVFAQVGSTRSPFLSSDGRTLRIASTPQSGPLGIVDSFEVDLAPGEALYVPTPCAPSDERLSAADAARRGCTGPGESVRAFEDALLERGAAERRSRDWACLVAVRA